MEDLTKTFPYFVIWFDRGPLPCEGTAHGRTKEEANKLAEMRVLFGSFDSTATVYKGSHSGIAEMECTYLWNTDTRQIITRQRRK